VSFAGDVALQADVTAGKVIFGVEAVCPKRRSELVRLLDIDLRQRLTTMSDGQRRRVQICMGLLKPYDVLLMDEITVDMDVLGRQELLAFFERESARRGATVVYATHIFDGLEGWVTHVAYMEDGRLDRWGTREEVLGAELGLIGGNTEQQEAAVAAGAGAEAPPKQKKKLLHVVEAWLRRERDARYAAKGAPRALTEEESTAAASKAASKAAAAAGRHMAFFR
jgi:CCR4-NOT complex subunit CAF16